MNKLIVANWKMNPTTSKGAVRLARSYDKKGVVIAPPFIFLEALGKVLKKAALGAQDVSYEFTGAHTGEISVTQLKFLGVEYVIIGHSERRVSGETDAIINKKIKAALTGGLKVILCVGEKLKVRRKGIAAAKHFVASQLRKDLRSVSSFKFRALSLAVAYEPIWAIGTGRNETPENASEMAQFIKQALKTQNSKLKAHVLYGGSVNATNAKSFLKERDIDGLLVGGASLKTEEFSKIIKSA